MEYLNFNNFDFVEGLNVAVLRGTYYDKLQYEEFFRIYNRDSRTEYGIGKVTECAVVRFDDITPTMLLHRKKDHIMKDIMQEYHNFDIREIVTLVYFFIHYKYEEREDG